MKIERVKSSLKKEGFFTNLSKNKIGEKALLGLFIFFY